MATLIQTQRKLTQWFKMLQQMLRFRLARKLFQVVFAAIVAIEFIIVIPSYSNYESSQMADYRELARVAASAALSHGSHGSPDLSQDLQNLIAADSRLVGASVVDTEGRVIASVVDQFIRQFTKPGSIAPRG